MNYQQEKKIIEEYFKLNWPHTPVMYENKNYIGDSDWVRLSIQHGDSFQATMGDDPAFRFIGVVNVQIFTKTDTGSGRALELVDFVDALFRNLVISTIQFKVPQVRKVPSTTEWFQVNVSTDFYRGS